MKRNQYIIGAAALIGIILIILDGKTAFVGASEGTKLCLFSVIPSLFPFIFLSNVVTVSFSGMKLAIMYPLAYLMGIPDGNESLLIPAFLGGYPAGAQNVTLNYHYGHLNKKGAERMLAFSNNAGPSFIFGIAAQMFPSLKFCWAIWLTQLLGALISAALIPEIHESDRSNQQETYGKSYEKYGILIRSMIIMGKISCLIILFRILLAFADKWFLQLFPAVWKVIIVGMLELSNGILLLSTIQSEAIRFLIANALLSSGGLCVFLQTRLVTEGLSLQKYFYGKAIHLIATVIFSACYILKLYYIAATFIFLVCLIRIYQEKSYSISLKYGV